MSCRFCARFFFAIVAMIVAIFFHGFFAVMQDRAPRLSNDALASEGAFSYVRPSDGQRMEFFQSNEQSPRFVVVMHGAGTTGFFCGALEVAARVNDVRLICPTLAGFGGSDAYDDNVQRDPHATLAAHASDTVALVTSLGAGRVSVVGVSMGSESALAIGSALGERLNAVASVVGVAWPNKAHAPPAVSPVLPFMSRVLGHLMAEPFFFRPMCHFLICPAQDGAYGNIIETMPDAQHPDVDRNAMEHGFKDIQRNMRHSRIGTVFASVEWFSPRKSSSRPVPKHYSELARSPDKPVVVWIADKDGIAPRDNQDFILERIPHAEKIVFDGTHLTFNITRVIQDMLKRC